VIVERNHVNLKKARFFTPPAVGLFYGLYMEFHRLSAAFYTEFSQCEEILTKEDRPYYVLLLELDSLTYAIPLRSHITHSYCFIADNSGGQNSGLDYSKAVVITDVAQYIEPTPATIRQHEFNVYKQREYVIKKKFSSYLQYRVHRKVSSPVIAF
jgi:protein AbiQ